MAKDRYDLDKFPQTPVVFRRRTKLTRTEFLQSIEDLGIKIHIDVYFEKETLPKRCRSTLATFLEQERLVMKPRFESKFGDNFYFEINNTETVIRNDRDFELFAQKLMADVLCIKNSKGAVSYLWHNDETSKFEIRTSLPKRKNAPTELEVGQQDKKDIFE